MMLSADCFILQIAYNQVKDTGSSRSDKRL